MRRTEQENLTPAANCEQVAERRRFERYQLEIPTMVELIAQQGARPCFLKTVNISALGAHLSASDAFSDGSKIRMSFILEFSESDGEIRAGQTIIITVTGNVLRSDASGIAVCFDENYSIANFNPEGQPNLILH